MHKEPKILSADEFGLLLFHIDQLPYHEAKLLETELKDTYRHASTNGMSWKPRVERSGIKKRTSRNEELGRQARIKLVKNDKRPLVRPGTLLKRKDGPI